MAFKSTVFQTMGLSCIYFQYKEITVKSEVDKRPRQGIQPFVDFSFNLNGTPPCIAMTMEETGL